MGCYSCPTLAARKLSNHMTADHAALGLLRAESSDCHSQFSTKYKAGEGVGTAGVGSQLHAGNWSQLSIRHLGGSQKYGGDPSKAWIGSDICLSPAIAKRGGHRRAKVHCCDPQEHYDQKSSFKMIFFTTS